MALVMALRFYCTSAIPRNTDLTSPYPVGRGFPHLRYPLVLTFASCKVNPFQGILNR